MIKKYLHFSQETLRIGLKAGALVSFFGLLQLAVKPEHLIFVSAMFGVYVTSLLETACLNFPIIQRLRAGAMIGVLAGPAFVLGTFCDGHYFFTLCMIVVFMFIVGISNPKNTVTATVILFTACLFVVGNGLPSPSIEVSLSYGLYFALGSFSMFALEYFTLLPGLLTKGNKLWIKRASPIFDINSNSIRFSVLYVLTVASAYSISYYFQLSQGFWVPMTVLLIMKNSHQFSWLRIKHRLLGSVLGFFVALPIGLYFSNPLTLVILLFSLYFLMVVGLARSYGSYAFFLTIMVTDFYKLINFDGLSISLHRLADTLLGLFIVAVILLLRLIWNKRKKL